VGKAAVCTAGKRGAGKNFLIILLQPMDDFRAIKAKAGIGGDKRN
jgi:hypothetical protein